MSDGRVIDHLERIAQCMLEAFEDPEKFLLSDAAYATLVEEVNVDIPRIKWMENLKAIHLCCGMVEIERDDDVPFVMTVLKDKRKPEPTLTPSKGLKLIK